MIKPRLYALCQQYAEARMATCQAAINAAQESANSETKSSAGDKYETGRAMAQNERDRNLVQLAEARKLLAELARIDPAKPCDAVHPGALVTTNLGRFYLGISAGKLTVEGQDYFAVSAAAPVAAALSGKRAGEQAVFNGKPIRVEQVQ
ncbi:3-oxoacyl-ACP synthase [Hymenobacter busanensis]|uniref:3-oxoacyl-ACP synthase n=1 Tax=Hymenobacter busanensis TaxID=2607656 RepID=A0A7L5A1U7_9BACT|nr:3-oxoacyl-ACP synthase [Hymenobacter busanensis]KAA9338319.1 3-oxoacyl-ACP synthase [Hymenobacter busanensis]QHJ09257.1 3-oxoacyl-ACP synthase [Hymenobacter busanensis]